jgi:SNF2 family DNA or RNA helicase
VRPFDYATPWYQESGARIIARHVRNRVSAQGWKLHRYQEVDLAFAAACLREHGAFYMGWERGLGKTLGTCAFVDELGCMRTLVVAPNTVKRPVWEAELARFLPHHEAIVLGNTAAQRARALGHARQLADAGLPFVLVVHYAALAVVAGKSKTAKGRTSIGDGWKRLGITWDLLVTDEDHRLSNTDTQMVRAYRKVPARMRLMLSGSIVQNHLEELYSPHHRGFPERFKSKWRDWNDRFLDYVENGYGRVCVGPREQATEEMRQTMGAWMVYRRKEDELDLPAKVVQELRIELTPTQRAAYDQLVDECLTVLDDGTTVKASEGIAMMTRLRQVATGLDLVGADVADSSKLDLALEMIVDNADGDFVVFSWYKAAVHALAERLQDKGVEAWTITGDTAEVH